MRELGAVSWLLQRQTETESKTSKTARQAVLKNNRRATSCEESRGGAASTSRLLSPYTIIITCLALLRRQQSKHRRALCRGQTKVKALKSLEADGKVKQQVVRFRGAQAIISLAWFGVCHAQPRSTGGKPVVTSPSWISPVSYCVCRPSVSGLVCQMVEDEDKGMHKGAKQRRGHCCVVQSLHKLIMAPPPTPQPISTTAPPPSSTLTVLKTL